MRLSKESKVICPRCRRASYGEAWDKLSKSQCYDKDMEESYDSIFENGVLDNNTNSCYKCPVCGAWALGSDVGILDKNGKVYRQIRVSTMVLSLMTPEEKKKYRGG